MIKNFIITKHLNKNIKAFLSCQTFKKFINFLNVEYERLLRKDRLVSFPYVLTVDVTNICNLHCPLCPTGNKRNGRKKGLMKFSLFKEIIDTLKDYIYIVNLYDWGEPLLHPDIYKIIQYADKNNIYTSISTNFSLNFTKENLKKMIDSGLKYLYVSIDGASQETYRKYRVGGDFLKVINNLKILINVRREMKSKTPFIEWRYLVFRHNELDIEKAKNIAKEIGIDRISFEGAITEDMSLRRGEDNQDYLPSKERYRRTYLTEDKRCDWLWRNLTINWDGTISPCCWAYREIDDFGKFDKNYFHTIWNNEKFIKARRIFKDKNIKKTGLICDDCVKVKRWYGVI